MGAHGRNREGGTPAWVELFPTGGPPLGREGGTVVYAPTSNRIIVFGGCAANCSPALGDVWVLSNANGIGGTPAWTQLLPANAFARDFHSSAYDAVSNRMIVFGGGLAFFGLDQNDVRVLSNADGTEPGTPTWTQLVPSGGPPAARQVGAAAYDQASNRLMVFGGATFPNSFTSIEHNDVWVLTNANGMGGTPAWTQLVPSGTPPPERWNHSALYDPSTNRLIVFGGLQEGPGNQRTTVTFLDDVWVLTNANGIGGTPEWIQLAPSAGPPDGRFGHSAGYASSSDAMVVSMGRNDTLGQLFNDVWVLTNANGIIKVAIDIKPGSFPNSINLMSRGVIPVAILTTDTFDATTVDPTKVLFGATGSEAGPVHSSLEDVDGDGDTDLILHFNTQATGIQCGNTSASLTGKTFSGQVIHGSDSVHTVGCK